MARQETRQKTRKRRASKQMVRIDGKEKAGHNEWIKKVKVKEEEEEEEVVQQICDLNKAVCEASCEASQISVEVQILKKSPSIQLLY